MDMPALRIGDLTCSILVVQGGMGVGISLSGLASAVAEQGGIGVIASVGLAMLKGKGASRKAHMDVLADEIRKVREKTRGVLGVNIMVALSNFSDLVEAAIREKVDVIFSGAGLPLDLPRYLTEGAKTKLVPIISSGRAAALICRRWLRSFNYLPDAFVLEGPLAGGHLGFRRELIDAPSQELKTLLKGVLEALNPFEKKTGRKIPIIAAGGVYTGRDVYELIAEGAAGVQMGTRFVATDECDADNAFKEAYLSAREEDVRIIMSPVGLPGRVIRNDFVDSIERGERLPVRCPFKCLTNCDVTKTPYCIAEALLNAVRGDLRHGFAFAGANVHRVSEIVPVKVLIDTLRREYCVAANANMVKQQIHDAPGDV